MNERIEHALKHARAMQSKRQAKRQAKRFIYFVRCHDFIKVGVANDLSKRLPALQIGNPYEIKLVCTLETDNAIEDEASIHTMWQRYEVRGEWFRPPADQMERVAGMRHAKEMLA